MAHACQKSRPPFTICHQDDHPMYPTFCDYQFEPEYQEALQAVREARQGFMFGTVSFEAQAEVDSHYHAVMRNIKERRGGKMSNKEWLQRATKKGIAA